MQTRNISTRCVKAIATMLLFFVAICASAQDADTKATPYIYISTTAYGGTDQPAAYLNDPKFVEPQVIVYDNDGSGNKVQKAITNRFRLSYSIKDGTFHKADATRDKDYYADEGTTSGTVTTKGTGTTVTTLYGDVETGSRPGTVTIVVTATPTTRYESLYTTATASYTITLSQETPIATLSLPDDDWKAAANSTFALPTFKVTYKKTSGNDTREIDITDLFTLTATDITNVSGTATSPITVSGNTITTAALSATSTTATAKVCFTLTPKTGYEEGFSNIANIERELTIVGNGEKIKPRLVFPEDGDKAYWGNQANFLMPTVYDQYGNDISNLVSCTDNTKPLWIAWSVAPLADGKTTHTPNTSYQAPIMQESGSQTLPDSLIWSSGPTAYSRTFYVGGAAYVKDKPRNPLKDYDQYNLSGTAKRADYAYKVYCQVYPKPHYSYDTGTDYTALYDSTETTYDMHVLRRTLDIVITPDPTKYDIGKGSKLSFNGRFNIRGVFTPVVDDATTSVKAGQSHYLLYFTDPEYNSQRKDAEQMTYTIEYREGDAKMNDFPEATMSRKVDDIGNPIYDTSTSTGQIWEAYMTTRGWGNATSWTIEFLKNGELPVKFKVFSSNDIYDNPDREFTFARVSETTKAIVSVEPSPLILYTSDTKLPSQPEVTITDVAGNDISSHYSLSVSGTGSDGTLPDGITYSDGKLSLDNSGTSSLKEGDYSIVFKATPSDADNKTYAEGSDTLRLIVKTPTATQQRATWKIVNKHSSNATEDTDYTEAEHGKLVFTSAGILTAGSIIDGVPGLSVQFGEYNDNYELGSVWDAKQSGEDDGGKVVVYGDEATFDPDTHLPVSGTYYILYPRVNGFLTVDAKYAYSNNIVLTSEDLTEQEVYTPTATEKGEHTFRYPLFAGTTYYLYNKGMASGTGTYSDEPLKLHGINFTPAFIRDRSDAAALTRVTAYAGSYTTATPTLTQRGTEVNKSLVTYGAGGTFASTSSGSSIDDYVTIDSTTGTITPEHGTKSVFVVGTLTPEGANGNSITTEADRLTIYAIVKSASAEGVVKLPYYNLLIDEVPTYMVQNLYTPVVGEETQTTNYPTRLTAYFGGWERANDRPYFDLKGNPLVDSWKTAKMDSVGANNRTIDAFAYCSFGSQNAKPEDIDVSYAYSSTDENLTYKVPCRGTYVRFEPRESGLLAVYLIQNGMVAYDGNQQNKDKSGNDRVKVNPVFITDEDGQPVSLTTWNGGDQKKSRVSATGAYTEGLVRCSYQELLSDCCTSGALNSASEADAVSLLKAVGYIPADGSTTTATIGRGDTQEVYDVAQTLNENAVAGSKGYAVISKAYTRYSFKVKAGKTYFVFMNGSKLGNGGYAFVPDGWTAARSYDTDDSSTGVPTICLDEKGTAEGSLDQFLKRENATTTIEADKTYNVKFYHKFVANRWAAVCLPFSVSETQFKKVFGDDATVISFDSIAHNETVDGTTYENVIRFTQHVYHWMVAGRPYFVRPGAAFNALTDEEHNRQYVLLDSVTFEQNASSEFTPARTLHDGSDFSFKGFYEPTTIKEGDYFLGSADGGEAMLYRATKQTAISGYRAAITVKAGSEAKIGTMAIGDITDEGERETTAIFDLFTDPTDGNASTAKRQGIYTLQGQRVGNSVSDMQHLPAGIYIVNGTKAVKQ